MPFQIANLSELVLKKQLTISKASRIERHGGEGTRLKLHLHSSGAAPSPQQVRARPVFLGRYFDSSRWIIWLEKFLLLLPGLVSTFYFLFLRTSEFGWSRNVNQILGWKKNMNATKEKWTNLLLLTRRESFLTLCRSPLPSPYACAYSITITFTV